MASDKTVNLSEDDWQSEVVDSPILVLVDFWAEWCGPCKAIGPVLDEIADEMDGKVKIAKVNVDTAPGLAGNFGVRSIPTLLLVKDGVVQEQMVGAMSKAALTEKISAHL